MEFVNKRLVRQDHDPEIAQLCQEQFTNVLRELFVDLDSVDDQVGSIEHEIRLLNRQNWFILDQLNQLRSMVPSVEGEDEIETLEAIYCQKSNRIEDLRQQLDQIEADRLPIDSQLEIMQGMILQGYAYDGRHDLDI